MQEGVTAALRGLARRVARLVSMGETFAQAVEGAGQITRSGGGSVAVVVRAKQNADGDADARTHGEIYQSVPMHAVDLAKGTPHAIPADGVGAFARQKSGLHVGAGRKQVGINDAVEQPNAARRDAERLLAVEERPDEAAVFEPVRPCQSVRPSHVYLVARVS